MFSTCSTHVRIYNCWIKIEVAYGPLAEELIHEFSLVITTLERSSSLLTSWSATSFPSLHLGRDCYVSFRQLQTWRETESFIVSWSILDCIEQGAENKEEIPLIINMSWLNSIWHIWHWRIIRNSIYGPIYTSIVKINDSL